MWWSLICFSFLFSFAPSSQHFDYGIDCYMRERERERKKARERIYVRVTREEKRNTEEKEREKGKTWRGNRMRTRENCQHQMLRNKTCTEMRRVRQTATRRRRRKKRREFSSSLSLSRAHTLFLGIWRVDCEYLTRMSIVYCYYYCYYRTTNCTSWFVHNCFVSRWYLSFV